MLGFLQLFIIAFHHCWQMPLYSVLYKRDEVIPALRDF